MIRKQNMSKATQKTVRTLYAFPKFRISIVININLIFSERRCSPYLKFIKDKEERKGEKERRKEGEKGARKEGI